MWYFIRLSGFSILALLIRITNADSSLPIYRINTCDETGRKAIFCDEGEVIKIVDVRLMPHNYSSMERGIVAGLCDGLNSCSFVDLRKQLFYYCQNYPNQQVFTSFQCIPANNKPVCRTNLCSIDSPMIKCRRGYAFHLIGTKCFSMKQDCPPEVIKWIYRTCEGQRLCQLPLIRVGIPQSICNDSLFRQQNLFMDYICVDKAIFTSTCTGTFIDQKPRFGVLQNQGYPQNPTGNTNGCYWVIYRDKDSDEEVEVTVHEAYTVEGHQVCDAQFLQVQYTLCETRQQTIDRFCDEGRVNVRIRSCGTVYVTHYKFPAGEDKGNRFLVSYSVKSSSSTIEAYEQYSSHCEKRNPAIYTARYTQVQHQSTIPTKYVKTTTETPRLPEDQPINDSSVGDTEDKVLDDLQTFHNDTAVPLFPVEQTEKVKDEDKDSFDPWRVVVVNIFLGLVIVALLMALAFVCYRYIKIGREKAAEKATKSETATTLDEKQSTEMQLLPQDGDMAASVSNKQSDNQSFDGKEDHGCYETTIFHFNRPNTDTDDETALSDIGTGVSSFLPHPPLRRSNGKPQNAESAYSSLDDEQDDSIDYPYSVHGQATAINPNTDIPSSAHAQLVKQLSLEEDSDMTSSLPSRTSIHQYKPRCEDYATVKRVQDQRKLRISPDNDTINQVVNQARCESRLSPESDYQNKYVKQTRCESRQSPEREFQNPCMKQPRCENQNISHIQAVPEDIYSSDSSSPTTMQLIPEHKCLLHKIPPPPPPPSRNNFWDASASSSSIQADV